MEERELKFPEDWDLGQIIDKLEIYKRKGYKVRTTYKGYILHSDDMTNTDNPKEDFNKDFIKAYNEINGIDLSKQFEDITNYRYEKAHRREKIDEVNTQSIDTAKNAREKAMKSGEYNVLFEENNFKDIVINGLTYIAENPNVPQKELVNELVERKCYFTHKDIADHFPYQVLFTEGLRKGDPKTAAYVIINYRDSHDDRKELNRKLLDVDHDETIYQCVRALTNNPNYTKEYVDSLKGGKKSF